MAQNNEKLTKEDRIQEHGMDSEFLEQMLRQAYSTECVPEETNIRHVIRRIFRRHQRIPCGSHRSGSAPNNIVSVKSVSDYIIQRNQ